MSKSEAVRKYLAEHPDDRDCDVVNGLKAQGVTVTRALVHVIRRPKTGRKPKSVRWVTIRVKRIDDPKVWQRKSSGVTTGLSVYEYLATLFQANEILRPNKKLTDEAILQAVVAEFPGRPSTKELLNGTMSINEFRGDFNRGRLTGKRPEQPSKRYGMDGSVVNSRTGKPLEG